MKKLSKRKHRGVSPLIAVVIIVSMSMYLSIAVALWMAGIIGQYGYGTRPIRLEIRNPITYGRLFRVYIRNMGGENLYIDNILVNNKFAKMKLAYDMANPSRYSIAFYGQRDFLIGIEPGQTIVLWALAEESMKAGVDYSVRIHTTLGFEASIILRPALGIDLGRLAAVKLIALTDGSGSFGYNGWIIEFNPATWEYKFWQFRNPDGNVTTWEDFELIGENGAVGTLEDPPEPIYGGEIPIAIKDTLHVSNINKEPTTPIFITLNLYAHLRDRNFTLINYDRPDGIPQITKFIMEKVPKAITGLDFIILWEDQWRSPTWINSESDWRSWIDHVVRVTWLEDGRVRIGVYRCSGGYLHVFYIGTDFIYYKPHGDCWGDSGYGTSDSIAPGLEGKYVFIEGTHFFSFYEIGYDGDLWISPNGYEVRMWYRG